MAIVSTGERASVGTETAAERSGDAARAGAIGPDPLAEIRAFLMALVREQSGRVGAVGGVALLRAVGGAGGGMIAEWWTPASIAAGLDGVVRGRAAALGERLMREGGVGAVAREMVPVPRPGGMYDEASGVWATGATLSAEGRVEGAVVLVLPKPTGGAGAISAEAAGAIVSAGGAAFEGFLWRQQALAEGAERRVLRETIELLDAAQQGPRASVMGSILCEELRTRFGCTRVSVGLIRGGEVRVSAVSGVSEIDRTAPAIEALEAAMEEAAAQEAEVRYPPPVEDEADAALRRVTRAHESLSKKFGPSAILTLPLRVRGGIVGMVVLEREPESPFPGGSVALLRVVAETIGPALWTRRLADRGVLAVAWDRTRDLGEAMVGPRWTGWKLLGGLAGLGLLVAGMLPVPDWVTAKAEVRAGAVRSVGPPWAGYLAEVRVRAGDAVEVGDVLAVMRTEELELQLAEMRGRLAAIETQRDEALGRQDLSRASVLEAQAGEVRPGIARMEDGIEKARIRAPISGVIGRGDLEEFVGARIEPTQALFEVISKDRVAVVLVPERSVQRVGAGARGELMLSGEPGVRHEIEVTRVTPSAEVVQGANVYRVEARVEEAGAGLPAGASGRVRLRDGWTTPLARLVGPLVDEARLRWWW